MKINISISTMTNMKLLRQSLPLLPPLPQLDLHLPDRHVPDNLCQLLTPALFTGQGGEAVVDVSMGGAGQLWLLPTQGEDDTTSCLCWRLGEGSAEEGD